MEFTIYTFGDVETVRAALDGVAMIFSAEGFFTSSSGVGLGILATVGLLVGLTAMLVNGVIHQKVEVGQFLVTVIVFVLLFVPKYSVTVEDYSGAGVARVDNVPLGVAFPAGLVSGIARELNYKMGTAFSTVQGYPSGIMTPNALSSPMKLLHSLRNGAALMRQTDPRLVANIANLVAYCAAGRPGYLQEWEALRVDQDPVQFLAQKIINTGTGGFSMYIHPGATEAGLATCASAAQGIIDDMTAFMASGDVASGKLAQVLTATASRAGAATVTIVGGGSAAVQPVLSTNINNAMMTLGESSSATAMKFLKFTMLSPMVRESFRCAENSGNPEDWAQCMPYASSVTQWQEDEATAGTMFLRIMKNGMNALFFIWICLAPVVAAAMLMLGLRGMRLAGSYLLFGIWTVSWYVGASIVNFYVLKQIQYETSMLGGLAGLSSDSLGLFFFNLGDKIAVGGTMLASVPLIMMTVLSGSVYGMVSMANRLSGTDRYNEKVNAPDALGSAPAFQHGAQFNAAHGGVAANAAVGTGSNINISRAMRLEESNSVQSTKAISESAMMGLGNAIRDSFSGGTLSQNMRQLNQALVAAGHEGKTVTSDDGRRFRVDRNEDWREVESNYVRGEGARSASVGGGFNPDAGGGKGGGIADKITKMFPISAGAAATDTNTAGESKTNDRSKGGGVTGEANRGSGQTADRGARLNDEWSSQDVATAMKHFKKEAGEQYERTFGEQATVVDGFAESGGRVQSVSWEAGGRADWSPQESVVRLRALGGALDGATVQAMSSWSADARRQFHDAEQMALREYDGVHGGEVLARYRALEAAGAVDPAAERQYLDITKQAFGANIGAARTPVSDMTADTNRESAGAAEAQVRAQQQQLKTPTNTAVGLAGSTDPGKAARGGAAAVRAHHGRQVAATDEQGAKNDAELRKLQVATGKDPGLMRRSLKPEEKAADKKPDGKPQK